MKKEAFIALLFFLLIPVVVFSPGDSNPSFEEDFGQMLLIGFDGSVMTPQLSSFLRDIKPGGVLLLGRNIESKAQLKKLVEDMQTISLEETGLPLFIAVDQEGKALSRIPFAKDARDLKELGVNMNLAPVLDSRNKGDFVYERSLKTIGEANDFIQEYQQENILAVPKHFPGYDKIGFNPEQGTIPRVEELPDVSLFRNVEKEIVMVSHVVYEDIDKVDPFPLSQEGIAFLKQELGNVLVMSDDLSSKSMMHNYSFADIGTKAIGAGVDILLVGGYPDAAVVAQFHEALTQELGSPQYFAGVAKLYEILQGKVEKKQELRTRIMESAEKIRAVKRELL